MAKKSSSLYELSFAGSTVVIDGIQVTDFVDDANPVEFPDVTITGFGMNCNGRLMRHAKSAPIIMSVTVIPGSPSDTKLWKLWNGYRNRGAYKDTWAKPLAASISIANGTMGIRNISFSSGTIVSGPGGPGTNAEGKMKGHTFTFVFEDLS